MCRGVCVEFSHQFIPFFLVSLSSRIDSHFLIKITDFGLSEDVFVKNYFRQGGDEEVVKLPVKWMAPESVNDGHFSEKSDVVGIVFVKETKDHLGMVSISLIGGGRLLRQGGTQKNCLTF